MQHEPRLLPVCSYLLGVVQLVTCPWHPHRWSTQMITVLAGSKMSPELDLSYVKEHQLMEIFIPYSDWRCASPLSGRGIWLTGFKVLHLFKSICC